MPTRFDVLDDARRLPPPAVEWLIKQLQAHLQTPPASSPAKTPATPAPPLRHLPRDLYPLQVVCNLLDIKAQTPHGQGAQLRAMGAVHLARVRVPNGTPGADSQSKARVYAVRAGAYYKARLQRKGPGALVRDMLQQQARQAEQGATDAGGDLHGAELSYQKARKESGQPLIDSAGEEKPDFLD